MKPNHFIRQVTRFSMLGEMETWFGFGGMEVDGGSRDEVDRFLR